MIDMVVSPPSSGISTAPHFSQYFAASRFWKPHSGQWTCVNALVLAEGLQLLLADLGGGLDREDLGQLVEIHLGERALSRLDPPPGPPPTLPPPHIPLFLPR